MGSFRGLQYIQVPDKHMKKVHIYIYIYIYIYISLYIYTYIYIQAYKMCLNICLELFLRLRDIKSERNGRCFEVSSCWLRADDA